jgi:hypothetical protein
VSTLGLGSQDDEEEDGDVEADPVLDHVDVTHPAAINRVRSCPQKPAMVATWGDDRTVRGGVGLTHRERENNNASCVCV